MKYSEATKLIQGLSKEYSINNDAVFELIYKSKPIAWVDKQQQFVFGRATSEFNELPYSHKLWMILAELAMTPISEREEHKWNVIIANIGFHVKTVWYKAHSHNFSYNVDIIDDDDLVLPEYKFTDEEFSDLIKYIKTLPDGDYQAKVAEHGKTLVKGE